MRMPAGSTLERAAGQQSLDAQTLAILRKRGERFTVPGFCRELAKLLQAAEEDAARKAEEAADLAPSIEVEDCVVEQSKPVERLDFGIKRLFRD